MYLLQSTTQWNVLIRRPHTYSHLDTRSLSLHKNDVFLDCIKHFIYYGLVKHISIHKHQILSFSDSTNYLSISVFYGKSHEIVGSLYNIAIMGNIVTLGVEYIVATFN